VNNTVVLVRFPVSDTRAARSAGWFSPHSDLSQSLIVSVGYKVVPKQLFFDFCTRRLFRARVSLLYWFFGLLLLAGIFCPGMFFVRNLCDRQHSGRIL
jgi:hypothetical protein